MGSNILLQRIELGCPPMKGVTQDLFGNDIWLSAFVKSLENATKSYEDMLSPENVLLFSTVAIVGSRFMVNNPDTIKNIFNMGPQEEREVAEPPRKTARPNPPPTTNQKPPMDSNKRAYDPSLFVMPAGGLNNGNILFQ